MPRCPACSTPAPDESRFCGSCGAALPPSSLTPTEFFPAGVSAAATDATPPRSLAASSARSDPQAGSRFLPGAVLAGRYRIVGLLGRGGMGEVYRADDLRLGQAVALKFLPSGLEGDEGRAARLTSGVRIARQVSHPNVCTVYDVGETDGLLFLSMEYVDGEDMASLIRRIGRLPGEKAVQIARQLCAGLAAAHEQGVIHRDLKPANVLIDGRGRVRITDFDLARLADEDATLEVTAGTPAYMAPEQLAGKEVTARSDLYSLGLVLYELFTGKPTFRADSIEELRRLHESSSPTSPSTLIQDLDPAVERTILRCLEKDPRDRPASALAVSAALPGGDPLAAALAAGETPSPEMVAAAGPEGGFRPGVAAGWLGVVLAGLILSAFVLPHTSLYGQLPLDKPVEVLAERAREVIRRLGYTDPPRDSYYHLTVDHPLLFYLQQEGRGPSRWDPLSRPLSTGRSVLPLFYRQSPSALASRSPALGIGEETPPPAPGDVQVWIEIDGRLGRFQAIPLRSDHEGGAAPPPDWKVLFEEAGLEMARYEPIRPTLQPRVHSDTRAAWKGTLPDPGGLPVRIEAAALRGRPVYFDLVLPYDASWSIETQAARTEDLWPAHLALFIAVIWAIGALVLAGGILLAVRNLRAGRGDRGAAMRLALFVLSAGLLQWVLEGHHVLGFSQIVGAIEQTSLALFFAVVTWAFYMAFEPHARRLWTEGMISWSRLIAGRYRDPLVGRDLLVGFGFGIAILLVSRALATMLPESLGQPGALFRVVNFDVLEGGRRLAAVLVMIPVNTLVLSLFSVVVFLLLKILLRKRFLTVVGFWLLVAALNALAHLNGGSPEWAASLLGILAGGLFVILVVRFGFVALLASGIIQVILENFPITADTSVPYYGVSLLALLIAAGLALYAFWIARAGHPLVREDLLAPAAGSTGTRR